MAITIFIALFVGPPYSNFMLGALVGILLYPVAELFVYLYLANKD